VNVLSHFPFRLSLHASLVPNPPRYLFPNFLNNLRPSLQRVSLVTTRPTAAWAQPLKVIGQQHEMSTPSELCSVAFFQNPLDTPSHRSFLYWDISRGSRVQGDRRQRSDAHCETRCSHTRLLRRPWARLVLELLLVYINVHPFSTLRSLSTGLRSTFLNHRVYGLSHGRYYGTTGPGPRLRKH
jgi:hypothetical protein